MDHHRLEEPQEFNWSFPKWPLRLFVGSQVFFLLFALGLVWFLSQFSHSEKAAARLQTVEISLVALVVLDLIAVFIFRRAELGKYSADVSEIRGRGFNFRWEELKSVTAVPWVIPGSRILVMKAKKGLRSKWIGFDPASVNEDALMAFAKERVVADGDLGKKK